MAGMAKAATKMVARVVFSDVFIVLIQVKKKRIWITERESLTPLETDRTIFRTHTSTLHCAAPW
jgi:hypothetical protein